MRWSTRLRWRQALSIIPAAGLFLDRPGALSLALVAAHCVLLGPGALSLDAHLFGRREIVFPHDRHPPAL